MRGATSRGRLLLLVGVGLLVRCVALWVYRDELLIDRDAYLGIARQIADGSGIAGTTTGRLTAFRPPLYPLALAALGTMLSWPAAVAVLNLVAGSATVAYTWWLGRKLLPVWGAGMATVLVAVDPLLVRYVSQPMTETLCAALVTLFLLLAVTPRSDDQNAHDQIEQSAATTSSWRRQLLIGIVFGLAVLCRPTILAAVPLFLFVVAVQRVCGSAERWNAGILRRWATTAAGAVIVLAPWGIRNAVVLGRPTIATTHGGYTLLLGNNPVYYEEVVARPTGTVWEGDSLARWQASLESAMQQASPPVLTELARDRWMYRRALANIREAPDKFLQACWLRCRRFWGLAPTGPAAEDAAGWLGWGVAGFYLVVLASALVGLLSLRGREWRDWRALLVVAAAFWLVHLVYWTDTRMRAPIVPILSLLAARAWSAWTRQGPVPQSSPIAVANQ